MAAASPVAGVPAPRRAGVGKIERTISANHFPTCLGTGTLAAAITHRWKYAVTDWFVNLKNIINRYEPAADPHSLPRAAAALMLEMALTDEGAAQVELDVIHQAMATAFAMDVAELQALLDQAHQARHQAVSLYDFTRQLRLGLEADDRAELVQWLWRVALADTRLDKHEELLVRRIADLLGVSHSEFIRRKHLAQASLRGA